MLLWCPIHASNNTRKTFTEPCPRGMYLDEATDKCTECPIGQYMDTNGTNSCKVCPHGQSTEKTGSKSLANCTGKWYF